MVSLPPDMWAELHYDGTWNPAAGLRRTSQVTITRGMSAESASAAEPTQCECDLDSRDGRYAPRNWRSPLFRKIGRNTPFRFGYRTGSPWVEVPGVSGAKVTTPDAAQLAVTDPDLRIELALEDWSAEAEPVGRYVLSGDNRSWALLASVTGLQFIWSPDGTLANRIVQSATELVQAYNGQRLALRVTLDTDNGAGGYELRFYTGRTVDDEEWTLLGEPVVGAATTSVFDGTAGIELGEIAGLAGTPTSGRIYAFQLRSSIGGTVVADMRTTDAAPGAPSFTSGGLVWTLAGDATLTNKHVRMTGEVPAWPPSRDLSGNDTYVSITPAGVTRRMDAGNKPVDSALLRYIKAHNPIDCWPLTDGVDSTRAQSLTGGSPLRPSLDFGTALPRWGAGTLAEWVEPTVSLAAGTDGIISGPVTLSDPGAQWSVDLSFSGVTDSTASVILAVVDRADGTDADPVGVWAAVVDRFADTITLTRASVGETSSSITVLATVLSSARFVFDNHPHQVRITVDIGGATTPWQLAVDGEIRGEGTFAAPSKAPRRARVGWFLNGVADGVDTPAVGYLTYWGADQPSPADTYGALVGFAGELAGDRIERLASEAGYTATAAGDTALQEPMGIQGKKKLLELLNEANRTAFGYLLEARDRNELIHRAHSTLWNQPPALVLDFKAGLISAPFRPVDDDKLTENDVSVKREFGGVPARQVLETGELSVQDPPDGVGRYDEEYTYSLATEEQAGHVASMRLHLGTYNGVRYARITLDLANERVHQMIDDILRVDSGDLIRLTGLPDDHGPDDVDVLVQGYTETAGPEEWKLTLNCVPAEPWTALVLGSTAYGRLDTGGCGLAEDLTETETAIDVTTTGVRRWIDSASFPSLFPFDVRVGGSGGEVMRVTACTGTTASQTFTVTRSINGVTLPHSTGADVRLATPVYLSL